MNTLHKQFSDALKREGKTITTYYTSESVKCLFRMNNDNNNTTNHITIFYDITAPIKQGQLLTYGGKNYITLNQESVENDTYYKSALLECNLLLPVINNSKRYDIPCYMYNLTSPTVIENNVITTLDGKGEIITESTEMIKNIDISGKNIVNIIGGWYKVQNTYNIGGISHVFIERDVKPADVYSFTLTSDANSYIEGSTTQLTASASKNYTEDTTATITYSTSDEKIATVDSTGLVTFISIGNVIITATWTEQTLTDSVSLSVVADPNAPAYTFKLICSNPSNEITLGSSSYRTFTPTLMNGTTPVTFTPVWTFNYNGMSQSDFTITYDGILCKIKVAENYDIIGNTLRVICTTDDGKYSAFIDAMLVI